MKNLILGQPIAAKIHAATAKQVAAIKKKGITPKLAVVLVGDDQASATYVKHKGLAAKKVGIGFTLYKLPAKITKGEIIKKLTEIQNDSGLSGLIVQLPLPEPLYTADVLNAIRPEFDVDCLTNENIGKLVMKNQEVLPPTPGAVLSILKSLKVKLAGKNITIIGVGALVGKPLAILLMNERASVTTCNSSTKDLADKCLAADIIVTGVGKKDTVRGDMVRGGTIIIDTGVDFVDEKMYGDVFVAEVVAVGAKVTPTPGGVGPVTVARLLWNTVLCAKNSLKTKETRYKQ